MSNKKPITSILLLATVLLMITSLSTFAGILPQELPPDHPPLQPTLPLRPSANQGKAVYAESCAPCHGETGKGDGPSASGLPAPPTDFTAPDPLLSLAPQSIFNVIKEGRLERGMPPWKNRLSDEAMWAVAAYLFDLHLGAEKYQQAKTLYEERCAACHGDTGRGDGLEIANMDVPDLTSWSDWVQVSVRDWQKNIGGDTVHTEAIANLSQAQIEDLLAYVRTLTYSSSLAAFRGKGIIEGKVEMMTAGEEANFEGLSITLFGFRGSMEPELVLTATVNADNTFRFENLSTESDALYSLSTQWEGIPYSSGVLAFLPGQDVITTTLQVAATTDQDPGLEAGRVHWFMDFEGDAVVVGELISISNPGDRAYIGQPMSGQEGKRAVIRWPLPEGATDLRLDGGTLGERFFLEEGVLIDTLPVPPGTDVRRLLFQYRLPIKGGRAVFVHPLSMPVRFLNVFIADRGERIEAPSNMIAGMPQEVSGVSFRSYIASNIPAGETLTFKLSNIPRLTPGASPHVARPSTVRLIGAGVSVILGLALFGGLVYFSRRRTLANANDAIRQRRDALLEEIAALDVRYQQGEIKEHEYREERDLLMAEAVRLTMALGEEA